MSDLRPEAIGRFNAFGTQINRELYRHVIRIGIIHALREPMPEPAEGMERWQGRHAFWTGFIVEVAGRGFVVTAGHVIRQIKGLTEGPRKLVKAELAGGLHRESASPSIELVGPRFRATFLEHDVTKVDYGLIELDRDVYFQLLSSGSRPITPPLATPPNWEVDVFVIAGFPNEHRSVEYTSTSRQTDVAIRLPMPLLPVEPLRDDHRDRGHVPRFKGRLLTSTGTHGTEPIVLASTNGMSGGPIFALRLDEAVWQYRAVAIQTSEIPDQGVVYGCYLQSLWRILAGEKDAGTELLPYLPSE